MSALPPPPPDAGGAWPNAWGSAPPTATPASTAGDLGSRPAWRQGRAGWVLLHLAIAAGLAFAGLLVIGIVLAIAGRTEPDLDLADETQTGLATVLLWVACLVGWLLFAYLDGSRRRRWIALGGVAGGGWFIALALFLAATG